LGIVGSRRKNGRTNELVRHVLDEMTRIDEDITSDVLYTADRTFHPCRVLCASHCIANPYRCCIPDDLPDVLAHMGTIDALVVGAPLYFRAPPAGFHALIERLISMAFYQETQGHGDAASPVAGMPCGLVAVAEYSNPHGMLEYLHDFSTLLCMRPVILDRFPYLGVGAHGNPEEDRVFHPYDRAKELASALAQRLSAPGPAVRRGSVS